MPRKAREKSQSGIYHIIMRGINRQNIFEDEEDYIKFKQTVMQYKDKSGYEIYAYCLMGNHVHLLIKVGREPLEQIMRRICGSYVYWYNLKYQRIGNLFQDRFKSEPVDDESYLLTVVRYIHQNPLKVGSDIQYKWSSYKEYTGEAQLIETNVVLTILSEDKGRAVKRFIEYNSETNKEKCLDIEEKQRITDQEAMNIIKEVCNLKYATEIQNFDPLKRDKCLKEIKEKYSLSIRQIERLTGINRGIVSRV